MTRLPLPPALGALFVSPADGTPQQLHDAAHALLREALTVWADERGIVLPAAPQLAATEDGKPYFTNVPVHMSLSHCKGMAACLLAARPCGVDCEARRPLRERVAARCFADEERAALAVSDDPDMLFTRLWTLKESYVKMTGIGIRYPMRTLCFTPREGDVPSNRDDAQFWQTLLPPFAVSVCVKR